MKILIALLLSITFASSLAFAQTEAEVETPATESTSEVIGCRLIDDAPAYQADEVDGNVQIVMQRDILILDLLGDLAEGENSLELADSDIEKIVEAVETNEIEQFFSGDTIIFSPGTTIEFTGQVTAKIEGLTAELFDMLSNAVRSSVTPGACAQKTVVLGCRIADDGTAVYQAEMRGDILSVTSQLDIALIDLLTLLPDDGTDIELEDSDIEKIIEAIEENEVTEVFVGDQITATPETTLELVSSKQEGFKVEGLTAGLYDTLLSVVKATVTPGACSQ